MLRGVGRRLDPGTLPRAGVGRVPDAVAGLRDQRGRGAGPVRRSRDAVALARHRLHRPGSLAGRDERVIVAGTMLPFARPSLDEATIAGGADVLRSGWITSGPWVQDFERRISTLCGGRPVRAVSSATAAIEIALAICGIGPGDEVITSAQTFFCVSNAIERAGATPVFVDCDLTTRNPDLAAAE